MARRLDAAERAGYQREAFEAGGIRHFVWRGGEGPAVLLLHEMPSISWRTITLANLIRDAGYRVAMPGFVDSVRAKPNGPVATATMLAGSARNSIQLCVSWQFTVLTRAERRRSRRGCRRSPGTSRRRQAGRVGVIGMCFSGGFALATAIDPSVGLAVSSQPALPMAMAPFNLIRGQAADPGISPADLDRLVARGDDLCVRAYRYSTDRIAPKARIDTLVDRLGPAITFIPIELSEIDEKDGTVEPGPHAHSVLTDAANAGDAENTPAYKAREALDDLLAVLDERLKPAPA